MDLDQAVGAAGGDLREKRESLKDVREKEKVRELWNLVARKTLLLERVKEGGKDSVSLKSVELEAGFAERATAGSACRTRAASSATTGGTALKRR